MYHNSCENTMTISSPPANLLKSSKVTYTESAPHGRSVALLRLVLPPSPADAHGSEDDARHAQAHLHHGQEEKAPQDFAAGAHPTRGISPPQAREVPRSSVAGSDRARYYIGNELAGSKQVVLK